MTKTEKFMLSAALIFIAIAAFIVYFGGPAWMTSLK